MRRGCWRLLTTTVLRDERGELCVVDGAALPFDVARVYFISKVPEGEGRGGHAHRRLAQVLVAATGSFDVVLSDGSRTERILLDRPDVALYVGPRVWRELVDFSADATCLVVASLPYDADDYVRSYDDFIADVGG